MLMTPAVIIQTQHEIGSRGRSAVDERIYICGGRGNYEEARILLSAIAGLGFAATP